MRNKKLISSAIAVPIILVCAYYARIAGHHLYLYGGPQLFKLYVSDSWIPQTEKIYEDKVVIVDMGSDDSWPRLWKSVGSFLEDFVQANIIVVPYREVTMERIDSLRPNAVVLTGFFQPLASYKDMEMAGLFNFLRNTDIPVLGICGGLQFIGKAYGSKLVPLGSGSIEIGFVDVSIIEDDPIFQNLPRTIKVLNWHRHQVDPIPENFTLLGTNSTCRVQILKHKKKKIYGIQFHPEYSVLKYQDGAVLMKNFLSIANVPCN